MTGTKFAMGGKISGPALGSYSMENGVLPSNTHFDADTDIKAQVINVIGSMYVGDEFYRLGVTIHKVENPDGTYFPYMMTLPYKVGTDLMDALWLAGARPSDNANPPKPISSPSDSKVAALEAELKAVKAHLEDMRQVVKAYLSLKD